jgi:F0F1-type ATP synthase assembly protein I
MNRLTLLRAGATAAIALLFGGIALTFLGALYLNGRLFAAGLWSLAVFVLLVFALAIANVWRSREL